MRHRLGALCSHSAGLDEMTQTCPANLPGALLTSKLALMHTSVSCPVPDIVLRPNSWTLKWFVNLCDRYVKERPTLAIAISSSG